MRTTVTLDPDVEAALKRAMDERSSGFKETVNDALRRGLGLAVTDSRYRIKPKAMGVPRVDLTHALRVAAAMEDEEIIRKMAQGR